MTVPLWLPAWESVGWNVRPLPSPAPAPAPLARVGAPVEVVWPEDVRKEMDALDKDILSLQGDVEADKHTDLSDVKK